LCEVFRLIAAEGGATLAPPGAGPVVLGEPEPLARNRGRAVDF
jgi:hypothetical protein